MALDMSSRWTGRPPIDGCPGFKDGRMTSLALPDVSANGTREALLDYFDNTWTLTEVLLSGLSVRCVFFLQPKGLLTR